MATVYFGTNRRQTGPLTFGAAMGPLDRTGLICAEATVDGLTLANADSGRITAITHETATGFAPATRQAILGSGKDLLVSSMGSPMRSRPRSLVPRLIGNGSPPRW